MNSVKGGLVILNEMLETLTPSEKKLAEYIIAHPKESIRLTASALGEKSQTSGAAVIRLCKSLGFNGFQELKIRVAGDLQGDAVTGYRDIEPNEEYKEIIAKMTSNTIQTIQETIDIMNEDSLKAAVEALIQAKSIVFIGFGASYISAIDAEQKFLRVNKDVQSFSDVHIAATSIANKGPDDVIVGISFSGQTKGVAKLLELAKQKGSTTISMTKYGQSIVSDHADIQLHTSAAKEATFRSGATSSRIAQLHLIDILFMCLVSQEYDEMIEYIDATREAVAFLKE